MCINRGYPNDNTILFYLVPQYALYFSSVAHHTRYSGLVIFTTTSPSLQYNSLRDTFHLDEQLADLARWSKIPYISDELRLAYNFMASKTLPPQLPTLRDVHRHPLGLLTTSILAILLLLISVLVYCHFWRRPTPPTIHFHANPAPTVGLIT
jgi:hypothetical protein